MKKTIILISGLAAFFLLPSPVLAYDLEVECSNEGCFTRGEEPLFSEENIYPGWESSKVISTVNKYDKDRDFALQVSNYSDPDNLGEKINIKIEKTNPLGSVLFEDSLAELYDKDYFRLSKVGSDFKSEYTITADLPPEVGNDFEDKKLSFNFLFGFDENELVGDGDDAVSSTSTPTPTLTLTPTSVPLVETFAEGAVVTPTSVLGEREEGEVSGEGQLPSGETEGFQTVKTCFWWLLGILGLVINIIFVYKKRLDLAENYKLWFVPILISSGTYLGDWLAHRWWEPSVYCGWMWLTALASFFVPVGVYISLIKPKR